MGQTEVFGFLKRNSKVWHTSGDIARRLGYGSEYKAVNRALKRFRETDEVHFILCPNAHGRAFYIYKYKK
jgi:prophage antirepressor-like protein